MENKEQLTLYHFLTEAVAKYADRPVARTRAGGTEWREYTYSQWNTWIQELAMGFVEIGAAPGDKIVHIADNRMEWMVITMAINSLGCVDVPRGTDATLDDLSYIIKHTEATILIIESDKALAKLDGRWGDFPSLKCVVKIDGAEPNIPGKKTYKLDQLREMGKTKIASSGLETYHSRGRAIKPDDLATIIYTSGTTGTPKGVMLRHDSLVWEVGLAGKVLDLNTYDSTMCFLPPWHIAERALETAMISVGGCGNFTSVPTMVADLAACRPTVMLAVPRVWEGFYNRIHDQVQKAPAVRRGLFGFAKAGASQYTMAKQYILGLVAYAESPSITEYLKRLGYLLGFPLFFLWGAFGGLILGRIRKLLGGRVRLAFSGAGALPHNIDLFFRACGVPIVEAYGMTETTAVSTIRRPKRNKFQTLGPTLPGIEIQLRDEKGAVINEPGVKGIAWHKGPNIMVGYFKEPEKTKQTIDSQGYLNSGDLLVRTRTGEYRFAGRAKDTIVLLGGENIEPVPIEDKIKESPYVTNVMVVGQDRKTLGAIVTPNVDAVKEWASVTKVQLPPDANRWNENPELRNLYKGEIRRLVSDKNGFKSFEKVTNFHILHKDFEAGKEMTETLKVKRNVVADMYAKEIDTLYRE